MSWSIDKNIHNWLPKLQSHRGLWISGVPQNTLASIERAYEAGYEMAEFDVRMTSDDMVILFHDTHVQGKSVKLSSYHELNSLVGVTKLEELFVWFAKLEKFKLNIEIKSQDIINSKLEKNVSNLIKKYKIEKRVMVSGFNPLSLFKMRLFSPEVYRALLLTFENKNEIWYIRFSNILNLICRPQMINLRYQDFSDYFMKISKKIPIVLWTVNDLKIYNKYKCDIHGIISDSITTDDLKVENHVKIH